MLQILFTSHEFWFYYVDKPSSLFFIVYVVQGNFALRLALKSTFGKRVVSDTAENDSARYSNISQQFYEGGLLSRCVL